MSILLHIILFVSFIASASAAETVAVLDFKSLLTDKDLGVAVAEILKTELAGQGQYTIVERGMLEQILEEQALQLSGAVDTDTAVKIGKLTGANIVVTGSIVKTGEMYTINSRFIEVETGIVKIGKNIRGQGEGQISNMVQQLALVISGKTVVTEDHAPATETPGASVPEETTEISQDEEALTQRALKFPLPPGRSNVLMLLKSFVGPARFGQLQFQVRDIKNGYLRFSTPASDLFDEHFVLFRRKDDKAVVAYSYLACGPVCAQELSFFLLADDAFVKVTEVVISEEIWAEIQRRVAERGENMEYAGPLFVLPRYGTTIAVRLADDGEATETKLLDLAWNGIRFKLKD
ncbi:MAG: hypothetical protein GY801_19695 [bacterium]|nr:hypothetical protein [bacterium]